LSMSFCRGLHTCAPCCIAEPQRLTAHLIGQLLMSLPSEAVAYGKEPFSQFEKALCM
jgi:hypothetical protein